MKLNEIKDVKMDAWKAAVMKAHPDHPKMKFNGRVENGKHLVCAEVPGLDRCFGVFDMDKMKGEVLGEEVLTEDWTSDIEGFMKRHSIDGKFMRGKTVQVSSEDERDMIKKFCKDRKCMIPNILVKMEEDLVLEKRAEWHDSDAPDANGKFKELGVNDLADWLIKTRGGDMQKITGSLNQQIVFNRKKNPSYAKKMESVRAAVKRKLKKD